MTLADLAPARIPFLATYKAGHELAGIHVERGRECGCGRWFPQNVVSQKYLDALSAERRKAFVDKGCEVETYSKGKAAWFPKRCHRCCHRQLEVEARI